MKKLRITKSKQNREICLLGCESNNKVLVIGVFHGDEPQGEFLINEYLKNNPQSNLLFIPCLNPDGKALNIRQNSNKVDLNRNFSTKNWIKNEDENYFGGNEPESEIETKFLTKIIEEINPKVILTFHAPYCVVNFDGDAYNIACEVSKIIKYPVQEDIGYSTPGSFGTYCGKERNIPTITLELSEETALGELTEPVNNILKYLETI